MRARIVLEGRAGRVLLPNGESFSIDPKSLALPFASGGDCQLVVVPLGEAVGDAQARDLLNQLLAIK
ncbi:MAG: hypothetical protein HYW81_00995 [Parcubacteria group bacterium]|nr:hypothetical protein [Parcubacteria group bacterium]